MDKRTEHDYLISVSLELDNNPAIVEDQLDEEMIEFIRDETPSFLSDYESLYAGLWDRLLSPVEREFIQEGLDYIDKSKTITDPDAAFDKAFGGASFVIDRIAVMAKRIKRAEEAIDSLNDKLPWA